MKHLSWGSARWLVVLALVGCSARGTTSGPVSCSPGTTAQCFCNDGMSGNQTCGADMTYGSCVCGDAGADVTLPSDIDQPRPDISIPFDIPTPDVTQPRDVPVTRDIPASFDTRPNDTGSTGGVCPATCGFNSDCDPCWRDGETRVGSYCCSSGLCIYSSTTCGASLPDGGGTGIEGGTDPGDSSLPDISGGFDLGPG